MIAFITLHVQDFEIFDVIKPTKLIYVDFAYLWYLLYM